MRTHTNKAWRLNGGIASVVSVKADFVLPFAIWTFDKEILSIDADSPGLTISGVQYDTMEGGPDAFSVEVDYDGAPPQGARWTLIPGSVHITFVDGSTLAAGTEFVQALP